MDDVFTSTVAPLKVRVALVEMDDVEDRRCVPPEKLISEPENEHIRIYYQFLQ